MDRARAKATLCGLYLCPHVAEVGQLSSDLVDRPPLEISSEAPPDDLLAVGHRVAEQLICALLNPVRPMWKLFQDAIAQTGQAGTVKENRPHAPIPMGHLVLHPRAKVAVGEAEFDPASSPALQQRRHQQLARQVDRRDLNA